MIVQTQNENNPLFLLGEIPHLILIALYYFKICDENEALFGIFSTKKKWFGFAPYAGRGRYQLKRKVAAKLAEKLEVGVDRLLVGDDGKKQYPADRKLVDWLWQRMEEEAD
ncbi:MAG: hypothetical protein PUC00_11185 [Clostridiales bacterium]|nr:hypothetical protein [Clostridiales bacterium]